MRNSIPVWTAALALGSSLCAQDLLPAFRDFALQNRTSSGTPVLQSRIYYPGLVAGQDQALRPQTGGYPVYVFLHGSWSFGSQYPQVGEALAKHGYVCVLSDTAPGDAVLQLADGIAYFPSLMAENEVPSSFFRGALDMNRAAIGGYSMGGMTAMRVLSTNCGYAAGFTHAPGAGTYYAQSEGQNCRKPFAIVHGLGDPIVGWQNGYDWWNYSRFTGQKFLYLMNGEVNHTNVISYPTLADLAIFQRCMRVCLGFLDGVLKGDAAGFEEVFGGQARLEPRLYALHARAETPALWTLKNGRDYAVRQVAEPGGTVMLAAAGRGYFQTTAGTLQLDSNTLMIAFSKQIDFGKLMNEEYALPYFAPMSGFRLQIQALSVNCFGEAKLSNAAELVF